MSKKLIVYDCNTGKKYSVVIEEVSTAASLISSIKYKKNLISYNKKDETFGYTLVHSSTGKPIDNKQSLTNVCSENDTLYLIVDTNKANSFPLKMRYKVIAYLLAIIVYFLIYVLLAYTMNIKPGWLITLLFVLFLPYKIISDIEENKYTEKSKQGEINKYYKPATNDVIKSKNGSKPIQKEIDLETKKDESKNLNETPTDNSIGSVSTDINPSQQDPCIPDDDKNRTKAEKLEYYFDNAIEFIVYTRKNKNSKKDIVWLKGDEYKNAFKDMYSAFEKKRYNEAILLGEKCFDLNPVAISVRFEMCGAYLALGKLDDAEKVLNDMHEYMASNYDVAQFYRRWGYLLCEKKKWDAAAACYDYSLQFENNPQAIMEMAYIKQQGYSGNIRPEEIKNILIANNVPIIEKDDIISPEELANQLNQQSEENKEEKKPDFKDESAENEKTKDIEVVETDCTDKNKELDSNTEKTTVPASPKVLFCRKCGAKLIDGSLFCNKCGAKI